MKVSEVEIFIALESIVGLQAARPMELKKNGIKNKQ